MSKAPYSLSEAEKICASFQHLTGHQFDKNGPATIDCVAVAPFDQENKNRFIIYYLLFDDARIALQQDYQGLLFDVIVIAGARTGEEMSHESLDAYIERNNQTTCQYISVASVTPVSALAYC